jgi:hypothetical protein
MPHIVLSEEQVRVVAGAQEVVELHDPRGNVLARVVPPGMEAEFIAEVKRRLTSDQPRIPAGQVKATMLALEEAAARGLDEAHLRELYGRLREGKRP